MKGWEYPQPEPGKAWRYYKYDEIKSHQRHTKKFPFFLVESTNETGVLEEVISPATNSIIHQLAYTNKKGDYKEVERLLNWLYLEGLITNPKSNTASLKPTSINELFRFGQTLGWDLSPDAREFHWEDEKSQHREAIRPTKWALTPQKLLSDLLNGVHQKISKEDTYQVYWFYEKIYQRAIASQRKEKKMKTRRCFLSGPLFLTKSHVQEKGGKSFHMQKEEPFQAHMTLLLLSEGGPETLRDGEVVECTDIRISEKGAIRKTTIKEQELIENLIRENLGKRDTIHQLLTWLKTNNMITDSNGLELSAQGKSALLTLEENFGQYIDLNYHRTLNQIIKEIETGQKDDIEVLQNWWKCFRTFLEEEESQEMLSWKKKKA
jgi:DNA topoisomerase IA